MERRKEMKRRKDERLLVGRNEIRYKKMISEYLTGEIMDVNKGGVKMKFNPETETFNERDGILLELPKKMGVNLWRWEEFHGLTKIKVKWE